VLLAADRPPGQRAGGHYWRHDLATARGRLRAADDEEEAARRVMGRTDPPMFVAFQKLQITLRPFMPHDTAALRALRLDLASAPMPPLPPNAPFNEYTAIIPAARAYLLGLASARLGDHAAAREYAAEAAALNSGVPDADAMAAAYAHAVHAESALVQGDLRTALRQIENAAADVPSTLATNSPAYSLTRERFVRAELLRLLGREQEAAAWYASVIDRSTWGLPYYGPVHLRLAGIHDNAGNYDQAIYHYARLLELWDQADPEFQPMVAEARGRLEALVGEGGGAGN
jgi:tetratricopeptide (TPR) repeat protein